MALGLELGIDELPIHGHFEAPSLGGDERDILDQVLKLLKQLTCQADGPVGVVSNGAVNDLDLEHLPSRCVAEPGLSGRAATESTRMLENYNMQRLKLCIVAKPRYNHRRSKVPV